jgi:hypothetical protein
MYRIDVDFFRWIVCFVLCVGQGIHDGFCFLASSTVSTSDYLNQRKERLFFMLILFEIFQTRREIKDFLCESQLFA